MNITFDFSSASLGVKRELYEEVIALMERTDDRRKLNFIGRKCSKSMGGVTRMGG